MIKKCKNKSHRDLLEENVAFPDNLWITIKKKFPQSPKRTLGPPQFLIKNHG